ncbi:MAG: hypothetical protein V4718_00645 [Pseudomonadota bacterium]
MPAASIKLCAALRYPAYKRSTPDGKTFMYLALRDTTGLFPDGISAAWLEPEALEFLQSHQAELVAGRCVDLEIYHVRSVEGEMRARIKACALAPKAPSHIKHEEKLHQQEQPA